MHPAIVFALTSVKLAFGRLLPTKATDMALEALVTRAKPNTTATYER